MNVDLPVSAVSEVARIQLPHQAAAVAEHVEPKTPVLKDKPSNSKKTDNGELKELQKSLAEQNIALRFSRDADTKILVVEMVDDKTGEAILQLPSKVSLKLAAEHAKLQGLFINQQV